MDLKDLKMISKLIKTYGLNEIEHVLKLNKLFLSYMNKEKLEYSSTAHSMYCETDTEQIFTNGETSIFCLKPNTIDFELLHSENLVSMHECVSKDEIQKYFDISKKMLDNSVVDVSYISFLKGSIISFYESPAAASQISIEEGNLIELLFKKYKIKGSTINSIIYVESQDGYAYILGKRYGVQSKF